jgi:hypothetical protein
LSAFDRGVWFCSSLSRVIPPDFEFGLDCDGIERGSGVWIAWDFWHCDGVFGFGTLWDQGLLG